MWPSLGRSRDEEVSKFPGIAIFGYFTIARFVVMFISTTNRRQACEKKGRNGPPIRRIRTSQDTLRSNIFFKLYWVSFQKKKTVILLRHDPHVRKWQTACKACSYEGSSLAMATLESAVLDQSQYVGASRCSEGKSKCEKPFVRYQHQKRLSAPLNYVEWAFVRNPKAKEGVLLSLSRNNRSLNKQRISNLKPSKRGIVYRRSRR